MLKCPKCFTASEKAWALRAAKNGIRPYWLTPAQWAWHPVNPRSIRRHEFITHDVRFKGQQKKAA
jgi:hypothetical protein